MRKFRTIQDFINISSEQRQEVEKMILDDSEGGRIDCGKAKAIAKNFGIPANTVGLIADQIKIRISQCQLGCF